MKIKHIAAVVVAALVALVTIQGPVALAQSLTRDHWTVVSTPSAGSQATASKAAGAAGVKHIADCIAFSGGATTAPALTKLNINLRDGSSGAGTILASWTVVIPAATGQAVAPFTLCGLNVPGTAGTAMTLEYSASLANLSEDVSLIGYDQP